MHKIGATAANVGGNDHVLASLASSWCSARQIVVSVRFYLVFFHFFSCYFTGFSLSFVLSPFFSFPKMFFKKNLRNQLRKSSEFQKIFVFQFFVWNLKKGSQIQK